MKRDRSFLVTVCWQWGPTFFLLLVLWANSHETLQLVT